MSILEVDTPPPPPNVLDKSPNKIPGKKIIIITTVACLVLAISVLTGSKIGGVLNRNNSSESHDKALIKEVGKLIDLPYETPIIASVTEKEIGSQSKFFNNAEIGDKILVYKSEKKVYLYRPGEKRIIEVGSVSENTGQIAGDKDASTLSPTATSSFTPSPTHTSTPIPSITPSGSVSPTIAN